MSSVDIGQYQLAQQHQAYEQWQSVVNWQPSFATSTSSMMSLATPEMASPSSPTLGTVTANLPELQYDQSSGAIWEVYPDGDEKLLGHGYSGGYNGFTEALNNPDMEYLKNFGPIPRGTYFIGPLTPLPQGPNSMRLTPSLATQQVIESYGRNPFTFLIHANNWSKPMFWSSEGCIVIPDQNLRISIGNGIAKLLEVMR